MNIFKRNLFIAGNWKMNNTVSETEIILTELKEKIKDCKICNKLKIAVCPSFVSLYKASEILKGTCIALGAQDISDKEKGAYTGDISADMLLDVGVQYVIIGHSERRKYYNENNQKINSKVKFSLSKNLFPIICVGETLEDREKDITFDVIKKQVIECLADISSQDILKVTIAYEPVWAIGTGKTATPDQAQEVHLYIRSLLKNIYSEEIASKITIQYGGSVTPDNASELMSQPDVDGALVGGASLKVESFLSIINNSLK